MIRFLILGSILSLSCGKQSFNGHRLVQITPTSESQVRLLQRLEIAENSELDFWISPSHANTSVSMRVPPGVYDRVKNLLEAFDLSIIVLNEDIQKTIDEVDAETTMLRNSRSETDRYLEYGEIVSFLKSLESKHPDLVTVGVYGSSHERRDLYSVKISSTSHAKPAIWVEAGTHAREWIAVATILKIIEKMADGFGQDSEVTSTLSRFDWYFAPLVNPDGYEYTHNTNRLWRKNRRPTGGRCFGVDLNRNWDAGFGGQGASNQPCSDTYHGPSAFSESENANLRDAILSTPDVYAFLSFHSYSQLLMTPFAYTTTKPKDSKHLTDLAVQARDALYRVNGLYFRVGTPPELLYVASGGTYDWAKLQGIKYSYVYELRPDHFASNGFVISAGNIAPSADEVWASLHSFARNFSHKLVQVVPITPGQLALLQRLQTDETSISASGTPKAAIWVEAGTHAREWIGVATILKIIERMATGFGPDNEANSMLNKYDGYEYTRLHNRLWRKNRRLLSSGCYGVDLNRNWDASFGFYVASGGASDWAELEGIKYSYTYELRPTDGTPHGFILSEGHITPSANEVWASQ